MARTRKPDPRTMIPLRPLAFSILLILKKQSLHGYAIMKRVNASTTRPKLLGPGTLYRTLKELRELGLIDHVSPPSGTDATDDRRSYYGLTPLGHKVARAEAERVGRLLREAHLEGVLSEAESS